MYKITLFITLLISPLFSLQLDVYKDLNKASKIAKNENKDLMVVFHKKNCNIYPKVQKSTFEDKEVLKYINSKYVFVSIIENRSLIDEIPEMFILKAGTKDVLYSTHEFNSPKTFLEELKKSI